MPARRPFGPLGRRHIPVAIVDQLLNGVVFAVAFTEKRTQRFSPALEEPVQTSDYGLIGEPVGIL